MCISVDIHIIYTHTTCFRTVLPCSDAHTISTTQRINPFLRLPCSCLRLLPCIPVTSTLQSTLPSPIFKVTCFHVRDSKNLTTTNSTSSLKLARNVLLPISTHVDLLPNIIKKEAWSSRYRCTHPCRRPYTEFGHEVRHKNKPERRLVGNGTVPKCRQKLKLVPQRIN